MDKRANLKKRLIKLGFLLVTLGFLAKSSNAVPLRIGVFDPNRGGSGSLLSSGHSTTREAIENGFPGTTITGTYTLTDSFFVTVDIVWLSSVREGNAAISPLTLDEQAALLSFVENGGSALLFVDNSDFGGSGSDLANESLIDPFEMDVTGNAFGEQGVTVIDPCASPVTSGPFGLISSFTVYYAGWLNNIGPYAQSLATLNVNGQPALAYIARGIISSQAGGVVVISDNSPSSIPLKLNSLDAIRPIIGDFNRNNFVDFYDFAVFAQAWMTEDGDPNFNIVCDISDPNDDVIDAKDLEVFCDNWLTGK